jgi:hypothetical protein
VMMQPGLRGSNFLFRVVCTVFNSIHSKKRKPMGRHYWLTVVLSFAFLYMPSH